MQLPVLVRITLIFHKACTQICLDNIQWSKSVSNIFASTFNMLIEEITLDNYYLDYYAPQTNMGHGHGTARGLESLLK